MAGAKKYSAAAVLAAWLIVVAFFMVLNRTLDLEVFFVLALIGLLVVAVLIDGAFSRPRYMRYIGYLIAARMMWDARRIMRQGSPGFFQRRCRRRGRPPRR